jgi:hypothetical protein
MNWKSLSLLAVVAGVLSAPVWAHHSHGNYDMEVFTTLTGTIKEAHFINPHSFVYLDVKGSDGKVTTWALEGTGPGGLRRTGWNLAAFKPGAALTAKCHMLKDKTPGCLLGTITLQEEGVERTFD